MNYMAKLKALELSDRTKNTEFYIKWENRIKELLLKKYPSIKTKAGRKIFSQLDIMVLRYFAYTLMVLRKSHINESTYNLNFGIHTIPIANIRDKCSTVTIDSKVHGIYKLIHELHPLFTVITKGTNLNGGRLSTVNTTIPIDLIMYEDSYRHVEAVHYSNYIKELSIPRKHERIVIDDTSLENYIYNTKHVIDINIKAGKNVGKLQQYVHIANDLLVVSKELGAIPHIINDSEFGRRYYKALNLQSCPSVVREAALGTCKKIDINSASFRWKHSVGTDIAIELGLDHKFTYTDEYITSRKYHINNLSEVVFGDTNVSKKAAAKTIKQAILAIGFGARSDNVAYWRSKSLRDIFASVGRASDEEITEQLNRFLNHSFMSNLIKEQDVINNLIFKYCCDEMFEDINPPKCIIKNGKINKAKLIAYLYQSAERDIISKASDIIPGKVILTVHDGFYTKHLGPEEIIALRLHFRDYMNYNMKITVENIQRYTYNHEYSQEYIDHMTHIHEEEEHAHSVEMSDRAKGCLSPI